MVTLTIEQTEHIRKDMQELYDSSIPFNAFWKSYFYMILRPKHHLRLLNFAYKIIVMYRVDIKYK